MKTKPGKFIVCEGLDGSGQSTQVELLAEYLRERGKKVHITSEPTNNIIGGLIRGVLTGQWKLSNAGLQLLYAADRAHHLESEVLPLVEKGWWVISSRYFFSSIAFGSLDEDVQWLESINSRFPLPDAAFFIRVPAKECIRRINSSRATKELFEKEQKLEKILATYDKIRKSKKYPNFYTINGEQTIEEVTEDIRTIIDRELLKYQKKV